MQPDDRDRARLWDMLDAAEAIRDFAEGRTLIDFTNERMFRNAVERNLEIIGEAANRISEGFRTAHPAIPWRPIIAQRHILAHEYGEIKHELIWNVVRTHLPALEAALRALIR